MIAIDEAAQELEAEVEAIMEEIAEETGVEAEDSMGFIPGLFGLLLMLPIIILAYGVVNEIQEGMGLKKTGINGVSGSLALPDIEII